MRVPPDIRQLPEAIANQIAAGEVVERPAAVVKELAENAIDAGATRITVRLEDGGRRLVEVADDGHGMRPEQLRAALARHATSKLREVDDLFRIATLGFRGEALPSIAAVSEFELASRPHDAERGQQLVMTAGTEAAFAPCAMAAGTRVSVRNLFWNVPARLKFLKSEASEAGHVVDQVMRLALSHSVIAFRCEHNGQPVLAVNGGQTLDARVRELFGRALADSLLPVAAHREGMQIAGFVAHPREAKPSSKRQYVFLNGRYVRDKLLIAAVREGFAGFLEPRLHGAVFLHLDCDPALVDVNVHPTKSEVRFRREGEVFALVSRALHAALADTQGEFALLTDADRERVRGERSNGIVSRTVVRPALPMIPPPPTVVTQERYLPVAAMPTERALDASASALDAHDRPRSRISEPTPERGYDASAPYPPPSTQHVLPQVRRILQLHDMFLLIETEHGIRLVDQHALHEKALFLSLDPSVTDVQRDGRQELVVPRTVELSAAEIAAVEPLLPALREVDIEAEVFGPTSLLLRAHPARLRRCDWSGFFATLAADGVGKAMGNVRLRIAHSAACHGAVKAGQVLTAEEQRELVSLLYRLDGMEHCPHGRPTTLDLSWVELGRRFQR